MGVTIMAASRGFTVSPLTSRGQQLLWTRRLKIGSCFRHTFNASRFPRKKYQIFKISLITAGNSHAPLDGHSERGRSAAPAGCQQQASRTIRAWTEVVVFPLPLHDKISIHIFLTYYSVSRYTGMKAKIGYENKIYECGFLGGIRACYKITAQFKTMSW